MLVILDKNGLLLYRLILFGAATPRLARRDMRNQYKKI
jgi:hypothetical protein